MTCQFLQDGRCSLAEKHAAEELHVALECQTTDAICAQCLKAGEPCEVKPSISCVGLVTRQLSGKPLDAWRKYIGWILYGKSRGLGDTVAKITRATGIDKAVRAIAGEGCGCSGRQKRLNEIAPYKEENR